MEKEQEKKDGPYLITLDTRNAVEGDETSTQDPSLELRTGSPGTCLNKEHKERDSFEDIIKFPLGHVNAKCP